MISVVVVAHRAAAFIIIVGWGGHESGEESAESIVHDVVGSSWSG